MKVTADTELRAMFAADSDGFRDDSFVLRTRALIGRARRRRRLLGWSAAIVGFALVGLASPWLIEGARLVSSLLDIGFDSVGDLIGNPVVAGIVVLIAISLAYRRRRLL